MCGKEQSDRFDSNPMKRQKDGACLKADLIFTRISQIQKGANSGCLGTVPLMAYVKDSILKQICFRLQFHLQCETGEKTGNASKHTIVFVA
jgi:hypothetical protein